MNASELITDELPPLVVLLTGMAFLLLGIGIYTAGRGGTFGPDHFLRIRASIEGKVAGDFVVAFLLLLVGGGFTYRSCAESVMSSKWAARALVASESGAVIKDALLQLTRNMQGVEAGLHVQRKAWVQRDHLRTLFFLIANLVCAAGACVFLLASVRREMSGYADAEEGLRQLNVDLERRTEEHAAERKDWRDVHKQLKNYERIKPVREKEMDRPRDGIDNPATCQRNRVNGRENSLALPMFCVAVPFASKPAARSQSGC